MPTCADLWPDSYFHNCHPWAPFLDEELAQEGSQLGDIYPLLFLAVVCIGAQFWVAPASYVSQFVSHGCRSDPSSSQTTTCRRMHPRYFELASLLDSAVARLLLKPMPSDATFDSVCALLLYSQWMPYIREEVDPNDPDDGPDGGRVDDGADSRSGEPPHHHIIIKSRYNDLSAWVVFGLAVRYATFLGLERRVTRPVKADHAATAEAAWPTRPDLAWARVWLNLVTYDCNLTLTSGLPASIDPTRVEAMARLFCQHYGSQFPGDLRYSALVGLACIMQRARNGERKGSASAKSTSSGRHANIDVLRRANVEFEEWERYAAFFFLLCFAASGDSAHTSRNWLPRLRRLQA